MSVESFLNKAPYRKQFQNCNKTSKRPRDSYVEAYLRFSDPNVLAEYINSYGTIRFGKILEDLDALAALVGFLHVETSHQESPVVR
jgi:acyl-coenzyme A thioesterase 9